ncbi:MAG TPA: GNAT family N-acetyltransferase [Pyrinomonadaceae bacterium]|nr:GNAT family N-acetyltransferase [Pyrinomonadaceae bacterium]
MDFLIRTASTADQQFLREMLYQSLYVPDGGEPFGREVLRRPEVARYVEGWGREGDLGFVAVDVSSGEPVAAVWLRLLAGEEKGYGFVDEETPELGMAVLPEYRGRGVGTALLERLLEEARASYKAVCLNVSEGNPARRLYERAGFEPAGTDGGSVIMIRRFSPSD